MLRHILRPARRALRPARASFASANPLADLDDTVIVTKAAADRIGALEAEGAPARLRLAIDGGGCSGFEYKFTVEAAADPLEDDDRVFSRDGRDVVVDEASMDFVRGATVDFEQEMIRSAFAVVNNPNSESACGCGSSFALKNFEENPAVD
mmetsp:Transcript_705/g.2060  ORF Transcript_705/g.2060 Transcript_705/m.2060 type:complete len:151 (+) Transcript_705:151-603(+)